MRQLLRPLDDPAASLPWQDDVPTAWDDAVAGGVSAFMDLPPPARAAVRRELTEDRMAALLGFASRMAAAAVRLDGERPIVLGLVALSLVEDADMREEASAFAVLRHSGALVDADPRALFDEAAERTDDAGTRRLRSWREVETTPLQVGLAPTGDGPTFTYRVL